jgi:ribosomal protein L15
MQVRGAVVRTVTEGEKALIVVGRGRGSAETARGGRGERGGNLRRKTSQKNKKIFAEISFFS